MSFLKRIIRNLYKAGASYLYVFIRFNVPILRSACHPSLCGFGAIQPSFQTLHVGTLHPTLIDPYKTGVKSEISLYMHLETYGEGEDGGRQSEVPKLSTAACSVDALGNA